MTGRIFVTAVVAVTLAAGPAGGAGVRLLEDAWLWGPAWPDSAADRPGAFAWGAAGSGRLFGMPELPVAAVRLAAGRRGVGSAWGGTIGWQRLGRDLLRIDNVEATAGRSGRWRCRIRAAAERQTVAGEATAPGRRTEAVLGWSWRTPAGFGGYCDLHLSLLDELVHDPRYVAPLISVLLRLAPVTCAVAWDRRGDGTPLLGAEVLVALSGNAAVSWRYDGGSRSLGWGLVIRRGTLLVRTSHLVHPDLGATHRWQLAAGMGRLPDTGGK